MYGVPSPNQFYHHPAGGLGMPGGPGQGPASVGMNVKPVGVFWDIENCPMPRTQTASAVIHFIRNFFVVNRLNHREYEFLVACDITKLRKDIPEDINRVGGVTLAHVSGNSKNAADEKLRESMKRFVDTHASLAPTLVLISGDIDFVNDLRGFQTRLGCTIIVLHGAASSPYFKQGWNEVYAFQNFLMMMGNETSPSASVTPTLTNENKSDNKKNEAMAQKFPPQGKMLQKSQSQQSARFQTAMPPPQELMNQEVAPFEPPTNLNRAERRGQRSGNEGMNNAFSGGGKGTQNQGKHNKQGQVSSVGASGGSGPNMSKKKGPNGVAPQQHWRQGSPGPGNQNFNAPNSREPPHLAQNHPIPTRNNAEFPKQGNIKRHGKKEKGNGPECHPGVEEIVSTLSQVSVDSNGPKQEVILMVSGLPGKMDFRILKEHLQQYASSVYGRVKYVHNGQGFITFARKEDAERAVKLFQGREVYGKKLNIQLSKTIPFQNPLPGKPSASGTGGPPEELVMVNSQPQNSASMGNSVGVSSNVNSGFLAEHFGVFAAAAMKELASKQGVENSAGQKVKHAKSSEDPNCVIQ